MTTNRLDLRTQLLELLLRSLTSLPYNKIAKITFDKICFQSDDAQIVPLAGYGYGIPLSRLYARYLGGDLMLQSIEGYGTDCFIYLKSGNNDAVEVLPIFTNQLGEHYKSKKEMKDWVSKAGLISSNQLNTSMRNN